ncbi:hypothetical protein [Bacteroides coprosuis]|nr:hypothetical protein [Bacteroides coprosuis]
MILNLYSRLPILKSFLFFMITLFISAAPSGLADGAVLVCF